MPTTLRGRVVYDRPTHFFTFRSVNRVVQSLVGDDLTPPKYVLFFDDTQVLNWAAALDMRLAIASMPGMDQWADAVAQLAMYGRIKLLLQKRNWGVRTNASLVRVRNLMDEGFRATLTDWIQQDLDILKKFLSSGR
jgi:hypothetical protein